MQNFVIIVVVISLGVLLGRLRALPEKAPLALNMIALYVCLPALILINAPRITFSSEALVAAVVPWALLLLSVALVLVAARIWRWERPVVGVLLLVVPLGNTSFLGVPIIRAFFGAPGLPSLIIYDQIGTMIIFATYGSLILSLYGQGGAVSVSGVVRRMLLFPPSLALAAGLTFSSWHYPDSLALILQWLAVPLVPIVMTAIGIQLRMRPSRHLAGPIGVGLGIKMLAAPLAVLLACRLAGMNGMAVGVSVMEAGMPPMVTAGALAVVAGMEAELATALVGIGIVCSFCSLPALYWLMGL